MRILTGWSRRAALAAGVAAMLAGGGAQAADTIKIGVITDKTGNARFYAEGEEQPQLATTMGIGTILDAKRIILQSFGHKKAQAVREAVEGAVSSFWPASALQLHPSVTFYLDRDSASRLTMRDYYRRVRENELRLGGR